MAKNNETVDRILERLGTTTIPATTEKFVASEKFVMDRSPKAKVKISFISPRFRNCFGDKVEEPVGEQTLRIARLRNNSEDESIVNEIGDDKAETTLQEMFSLMEKQGGGEDGDLLTDGHFNIFYVCDTSGVLRAVLVGWRGGPGWHVFAARSESLDERHADYRVFSRLPAGEAGNS